MTIFDFFTNINLTSQQKEVLKMIEKFLSSDAHIFLLKGYAGTGKTTILEGIAKYCKAINIKPDLMAPTGRASRVITEKTDIEANTIHRTIYSWEHIEEKGKKENKEKKHGDDLSYRFHFLIKNNNEPNNNRNVFLIDEASMISNKFNADKYFIFGTGHLLADLLTYYGNPKHHKRKIIFVGDPAQLPPVGSPNSPALIPNEINSINPELEVWQYELTEVLRQKTNSGILFNANKIRNAIKQNLFSNLNFETNYSDTNEIETTDLWNNWKKSVDINGLDETILITETNSMAKKLNELIREKLYPKQKEIREGDLIIINQNNTIYKLNNGEFAKVIEINKPITIKVRIKKNPEPIFVPLTFRDIKIEYYDYLSKTKIIIPVKIIENLLYSNERDLTDNEKDALYIHYRIRTWNKNTFPETPDFAINIKDDIYFNSLRIKFGYAITCHKAQGGEWKNAIIRFEKERKKQSNEPYFRWVYTATTRAKDKLFVINPPKIKVTDKIVVHPIEQIIPFKIPIKFETNIESIKSPFHDENYDFLISKYNSLKYKCEDNRIKITNVQSRPKNYFDRYTFEKDEITSQLDFYFNGKKNFTKINVVGNENELSKQIIELDKLPISGQKKIVPFVFESDDITKQKIYEFAKKTVEINNSIITYIKPESWCLNIHVQTNAETSFLKIYHKKKGFISEIFPLSSLGVDDEILDKICISLQNN